MLYVRDDQADVRVSIDGVPYFNSWATYSGGDLSAAEAKTRPGGMGHEVSIGGPASRADQTLTIQWSDLVIAKFAVLESKVGNGRARVSLNWLGPDRIAIPGALFVRLGTVKGLSDPNYDHNGNAVGFMTLVIGSDELAG